MKTKALLLLASLISSTIAVAQGGQNTKNSNKTVSSSKLETTGLNFIINDSGINTEMSEVGSTFFMDKYLILSNKKRGFAKVTTNENNNANNNLFCANIDKYGNLSYPIVFSKILDSETNEGGVAFSPDQKTMYLTRAKAENTNQFELYKATLDLEVKGYWKDVQKLAINGDFSIETPSMNAEGTKMYFASDMAGGFGGYDIYAADVLADGTLSNIANLGTTVNSAANEKHPYTNGRYIFFSSEGHENYGGYDIFRASMTDNGVTNRVNIGNTLNTNNDEVAFILSGPNKGYVSSNKNNNKEDYNVYKFELTRLNQKLNALVVETNSKVALPNTNVVIANEFGEIIKTTTTDENGKISLAVEPLTQYTITAEKDGYDNNQSIFRAWSSENNNYNEVIAMNQTKAEIIDNTIVIENIYFDFNKASVKKESELSLNKIIEVLNTNPEMKIAINAHTDAKGSDAYNMTLSEKRAKSAYEYLVKKGISKDRLEFKGFGESQLKFDCGAKCSEKEDSLNRRIEFLIK
ncbi:OmpA family protein [Flavobacterium sp.]|uniref:OmpA family protein n=1 Tax=Flavobacterium sp. TaxID=239 RepID=UPI0028BD2FB8|nr:OmpA family protein [Flavobacterium sp.]